MKATAQLRIEQQHLTSLRSRREKLHSKLGNAMAIVVANEVPRQFHRYGYRQSSSFYYLTGLPESDAIAVFTPAHPTMKSVLFLRERDATTELWNGPMLGVERATSELGFDAAFPLSALREKLPELMKFASAFYWDSDPTKFYAHELRELIYSSDPRRHGAEVNIDVEILVGELRLIKDEFECAQLQRANDIASRAHEAAMRRARPGLFEYQIQATLEAEMMERGALARGYTSIVAAGSNSCCLHYSQSTSQLEAGDLLLIDAGAECGFYTADITRTFPVGRNFSAEQRAVYEAVLDVQKQIIEMVKPGIRFPQLNERTIELTSAHLIRLGLLKGSLEEVIEKKTYQSFYPHGVSHWLGLDVHDVGKYKINNQGRIIEPGMCFTIEPGIYIQRDNETVPEVWRGIGVRIEDDVCVTESGVRNFTTCVKEIDALEALK